MLVPVPIYSVSFRESLHGDRSKLPRGCGSCHKGHGKYNTPMLPETRDVFCFRCHGNSMTVEATRQKGDISPYIDPVNVQRAFEKPYRHPIDQIPMKNYEKTIPERDASAPRTVECRDCHNHHVVSKDNKIVGISGLSAYGSRVDKIEEEYELCYKCHSYSANLPADQQNKAELFDASNPSYHPVVAPGKNDNVPSLTISLPQSRTIRCTDCHNNNDPLGPRGPHGSAYKYLLTRNFSAVDGPEDSLQYELCYGCHNRNSILGNQSFLYHNLHISTVGTSCRTCHNPHGSYRYTHLMELDNFSISPSDNGRLEFLDFGDRSGQCFLNCHGKNHEGVFYPGGSLHPASRK